LKCANRSGHDPDALAFWLALQTLSPEATQHLNAARRAESQQNFDLAVAEYRKVTELDPAFAEALSILDSSHGASRVRCRDCSP